MLYPIVFLIILSIFMGIGAEFVYPHIETVGEYLLNPEAYINSVLKE